MSTFKQAPHNLLVIPGPIEVSDEVLYANALPPLAHAGAEFIPLMGDAIRMTREVVFTQTGQPFLIAGSGTLGWDQVAANLIEPGEDALLLNCGYFGDSFADCLRSYGANVHELRADFGKAVSQHELEAALKAKKYKLVCFTHVDTSTAVLSDAKMIGEVAKRLAPESLVILDGVCSVASEEIRMDAWNIDVVVSASQKGLGAPPGISVVVASQKALKVAETRKAPVAGYYSSWKRWLPIMHAYEAGKPSYFATPPTNLIVSYRQALLEITKDPKLTLEDRFKAHIHAADRIRNTAKELGLKLVPADAHNTANGMTAIYVPEGLAPSDIVSRMAKKGIVVTGGIHKENKDKYFRIGHMGVTAVNPERGDLDRVIAGLKESLAEAKASKQASQAKVENHKLPAWRSPSAPLGGSRSIAVAAKL
ncbi:alanine--glyoxylate aminotransferase family protein [Phanerochaete sordida]|uniref:alanine--glyoxylate transaminase n=1 Tax=Phanerochaete sordida TaxID=48140 RepID=A0A9P3LD39_9APHY|nr:alanine--glyoxylate aminotransferase family protein [Phanerochaete sordida]